MILSIDIETKSNVDLTKSGVYKYCEDDSFEILMMAYAFDDEEVEVIELVNGQVLSSRIKKALLDDNIIKYAFNANFERVCRPGRPTRPCASNRRLGHAQCRCNRHVYLAGSYLGKHDRTA